MKKSLINYVLLLTSLYSIITGQLFSSIPNESILPLCLFPVLYSDARKRIPKNVSKFCSHSFWISLSYLKSATDLDVACPPFILYSLMSAIIVLLKLSPYSFEPFHKQRYFLKNRLFFS